MLPEHYLEEFEVVNREYQTAGAEVITIEGGIRAANLAYDIYIGEDLEFYQLLECVKYAVRHDTAVQIDHQKAKELLELGHKREEAHERAMGY